MMHKLYHYLGKVYSCYTDRIHIVFLIIVSICVFSFNLSKESFWIDEAASYFFSVDFARMLYHLAHNEINMWLYYVILHFWLFLGNSEFVIRFLSVVFATAAVGALYLLGKQIATRRVAMLAAIFFLLNTFFIQYAQEVRGYSMLVFLFIVATLFTLRTSENLTYHNAIGFLVSSVLMMYTFSISVGLTVIHCLYIFFRYRHHKSNIRKSVFLVLCYSLLISPLLVLAHIHVENISWIQLPQLDEVMFFIRLVSSGSKFLMAVLVISIVSVLVRTIQQKDSRWALVLSIVVLPPIALFIGSYVVTPLFVPRYMLFVVPFAMLLLAQFVFNIPNSYARSTVLCVLLVLFINTVVVYNQVDRNSDWRALTQWVQHKADDGAQIVFIPDILDRPYTYYRNDMALETRLKIAMDPLLGKRDSVQLVLDNHIFTESDSGPYSGQVFFVFRTSPHSNRIPILEDMHIDLSTNYGPADEAEEFNGIQVEMYR